MFNNGRRPYDNLEDPPTGLSSSGEHLGFLHSIIFTDSLAIQMQDGNAATELLESPSAAVREERASSNSSFHSIRSTNSDSTRASVPSSKLYIGHTDQYRIRWDERRLVKELYSRPSVNTTRQAKNKTQAHLGPTQRRSQRHDLQPGVLLLKVSIGMPIDVMVVKTRKK